MDIPAYAYQRLTRNQKDPNVAMRCLIHSDYNAENTNPVTKVPPIIHRAMKLYIDIDDSIKVNSMALLRLIKG